MHYLLIIRRHCMYNNWYILWNSTPTLLAASWHNKKKSLIYSTSWWWANKCSKHVEAINLNKLKANSASCWSYYTDGFLDLSCLKKKKVFGTVSLLSPGERLGRCLLCWVWQWESLSVTGLPVGQLPLRVCRQLEQGFYLQEISKSTCCPCSLPHWFYAFLL
jgi:hypothetical protein